VCKASLAALSRCAVGIGGASALGWLAPDSNAVGTESRGDTASPFYVVREFAALLAYKSGRSTQNLAPEKLILDPRAGYR